jgi:hypothetical protein
MLSAFISAASLAFLIIGLPAPSAATGQTAKAPVKAPAKAAPRTNPNAAVISDFMKRVEAYVALHKKHEDTLPKLSKQTTPQEIDTHQRALAKLIQASRKDAKSGDLLTPAMQRLVRTILQPIFAGKDGAQIKAEILDKEYKGGAPLAVNARYPDEVPVSTMPPQVLEALPKLPEEIEYRFIQNNLILFDSHAHIIADYMIRAFN